MVFQNNTNPIGKRGEIPCIIEDQVENEKKTDNQIVGKEHNPGAELSLIVDVKPT